MIVSPTEIQRNYLEQQYKDIQEECSAINDKLRYSDGTEALRLHRERDETFKRMEKVYQQLQELKKQLAAESQPLPAAVSQSKAQRLSELLQKIDFKQQSELFKAAIDLHQASAFLVHSASDCGGQSFLVTRLRRSNRKLRRISPIRIEVSSPFIGARIPKIWENLAGRFKMPETAEPRQIIETICECLQTQDIVLIFNTVDLMSTDKLKEWLRQFWEPLVTRIKASPTASKEKQKHLLMFLIDLTGRFCPSDLILVEQCNHPDYPKLPLALPPVCPFPSKALEDWLDDDSEIADLLADPDLTIEMLMEKTGNGMPEEVYKQICFYCNQDWEEVAQCLV